jgi:hypothetical protein
MGRTLRALLSFAVVVSGASAGCIIKEKHTAADGAACASSEDCKSSSCNEGACVGSSCSGTGQSTCDEGWKCVHYEPGFSLFGSGSAHDTCTATCGHCPLHYKCDDYDLSKGDGAVCSYDANWKQPKIVVDEPPRADAAAKIVVVPGQEVKFHATVTSGSGDVITEITWLFEGSDQQTGASAKHIFRSQGSASQGTVQITAVDAHGQRTFENFTVDVCGAGGERCDPSGLVGCCGALRCVGGSFDGKCQD